MTRYLSSDWLAAWTDAVARFGVACGGPEATVEIRVDGGPEGPVTWRAHLAPGAPPRYGPGGGADEPDATYEQTWADAVAQLEGRFDPCVAFMQGNLKARGATRPLYELFRLWDDPSHRAAWAELVAATER